MVAAAVVAAGALTAGAAAYSGNKASKAQTSAADAANATQQDIYSRQLEQQQKQYDQTRADQAPYQKAGYAALSRMQDLLGLSGNTAADGYGSMAKPAAAFKPFSPGDLTNDPGYQFELKQGIDTAQNSAAARGGLYSGSTLKALTKYGNDYAGTKYGEAAARYNQDQATEYNRFNQDQATEYNRLAGVSGTGQTSTQQVESAGQNYANQSSQAGQNYANQVGGNLIGAGNARGAAAIATGNAVGGAANSGAAWWLRSQPSRQGGISTNSAYGGGGTGYDDQNGSDIGTGGVFSDIRLKTRIVPLGVAKSGLPIYAFDYVWGGARQFGHMAHEVREVFPDAVSTHASGFLMVDYSKVH